MRCVVCLCVLLGSLNALSDEPAKAPTELQGTWRLVSIEDNGAERELPEFLFVWVIQGGKVHYGGEQLVALRFFGQETPRSVDLAFIEPKQVLEGIYSVNSNELRICVNVQADGVKNRPSDFTTKDSDTRRLLVFERIKDRTGDPTEGHAGFVGIAIRYDAESKKLLVDNVIPNGPAMKAGLKKDDVLRKVAGVEANDLLTAVKAIRAARPKSELTFQIMRDGKEHEIKVKAGVMPFHILL